MVESFDATPLDTTLTLPAGVKKGERLPLIVFLHGFLSNKGEYISDTEEAADDYKTVEFNNLWFASRGYAVLNYDARGHGDSGGQIALASKNVRDTRHAAPDRPAGGRRHREAQEGRCGRRLVRRRPDVAARDRSRRGRARSTARWRSPKGKVVRLAAAVPQFTWTDLLFSLVPNGLNAKTTPLGVAKITLLNGFIALIGIEDDRGARGLARAREPGRALRRRSGGGGGEEGADRGPLALLPGRLLQGAEAQPEAPALDPDPGRAGLDRPDLPRDRGGPHVQAPALDPAQATRSSSTSATSST